MRRLTFRRLASHQVVAPVTAVALTLLPQVSRAACNSGQGLADGTSCGQTNNLTLVGSIKVVTNTLLFIVGIAAVIVIVVGGLRYVLSAGNSQAAAGAKDTILYAVIGLVVSLLAYAIVNFVLGQFS